MATAKHVRALLLAALAIARATALDVRPGRDSSGGGERGGVPRSSGNPSAPRPAAPRAARSYVDKLKYEQGNEATQATGSSAEARCKLTVHGATYDLSPLHEAIAHGVTAERGRKPIDSPGSLVLYNALAGRYDVPHMRYTYFVGFCANVAVVPPECDHLPPAAAYQVSDPRPELMDEGKLLAQGNGNALNRVCHALGTAYDGSDKPLFSYANIAYHDPKVGVQLIYPLGENCTARRRTWPVLPDGKVAQSGAGRLEWVTVPRELIINVRCAPEADVLGSGSLRLSAGEQHDAMRPDDLSSYKVTETDMCSYVLNFPSKHGCPTDMSAAALNRLKAKREQATRRRNHAARAGERTAARWSAVRILFFGFLLACAVLALRVYQKREWITIYQAGLRKGDLRVWRKFLLQVAGRSRKEYHMAV